MSDDYPRVARTYPLGRATWDDDATGPFKVVPADAIVIERGDLPGVLADWERDLLAGPGSVAGPRRTYDDIWREVLSLVAEAEYLRAHPPVDEAQVNQMLADISVAYSSESGTPRAKVLARRLVEQGWTKPEPRP